MCGILGWAGSGRPPFEREQFKRALSTLTHRGPDDSGIWSADGILLGHRRLSIIDLTPAGHQPMRSRGGTSIVYNGEVYNYIELRSELERLGVDVAGGSDTGVLLAALELWGPAALPRLNGMWAFGVWSASTRQLMLCRDRFGVKPLYYRLSDDGIVFASEPKALLALYPENRRVCRRALLDFLAYNQLFTGRESFYEGIQVLPPAHYAIYDPAKKSLDIRRYWDYPQDESGSIDARRAVDEFQALFVDAVRIRLRSDVPVGITLSGGLDSSAVLAAAVASSSAPPTCFTSTYIDSAVGEVKWANMAARSVDAPLIAVPAAKDDWLKVMRDVVWYMDGPGYSPAVYPLWCLMRTARETGVPVLVEGQGADEALGGYPQYSILSLLDFAVGMSEPRVPSSVISRFAGMRGTFSTRWAIAWLARELSPTLLGWHRSRVGFQALLRPGVKLPEEAQAEPVKAKDRVRERLITDHARDILPGLLHYGDAISMAHSIEARNPFLDYRLVEWMFRLPTGFKIREGQTKWVLREYLRNNGMKAIGDRRDKRGYPTPTGDWLASEQAGELKRNLVHNPSPLHEWIEPRKLNKLFELQRKGALAAEHHLYKLLSVQMWIDRCISGVGA
jgi:asparagine synthase (glutamine-hydrolysing)